MLIAYNYDGNDILSHHLLNREAKTILMDGYAILNNRLTKAVMQPSMYIFDNECSTESKITFCKHNITYQLDHSHLTRVRVQATI